MMQVVTEERFNQLDAKVANKFGELEAKITIAPREQPESTLTSTTQSQHTRNSNPYRLLTTHLSSPLSQS